MLAASRPAGRHCPFRKFDLSPNLID